MLDDQDLSHINALIKAEVHEYFDTYLHKVFPAQVHSIMEAHNSNCNAHNGAIKDFYKLKWMVLGAATLIGFGGGLVGVKLLEVWGAG